MKNKPIILIFVLLSATGIAQQDPQFSQYMFNRLIVNPAYAGSREAVSGVLLYRSQWTGFEGAPTTQTLSVHAPVTKKKIGLGGGIIHDHIGPTSNLGIFGAYAYSIRLGRGKLSFGLKTTLYNYRFDWNKIKYKDPNEVYDFSEITSDWLGSIDFGMRYYSRTFYIGVSFNHLNQPSFFQNITDTAQVGYYSYMVPHLYLTVGKAFELSDAFVLKPSLLLKTSEGYYTSEGNLWMADFNISVTYDRVLTAGLSARTRYGFIFIAEYNITDRLRAGYSYDFGLTRLAAYHKGSHEIFIGYDLPLQKNKVLSPRYF